MPELLSAALIEGQRKSEAASWRASLRQPGDGEALQ